MPLLELGRLATLTESVARIGTCRGSFLLAQRTAIDEGVAAGQIVIPPTWSGNDLRPPEGAAASEEHQPPERALAIPTDWRADA
jgi:hypothetical protein